MKKGKLIIALSVLLTACMAGGIFTACRGGSGKAGEPVDPIDESAFGSGRPDQNIALETDADMTVDGKFNEVGWSQSIPFTSKFGDGVEYSVKTLFGDMGVYIGFSVKDTKIFGSPFRPIHRNSGVEIYMSVGSPNDGNEMSPILYRHDVAGATKRYIGNGSGGYYNYDRLSYLPIFSRMQLHGEINGKNSEGVDYEIFVRWDALCADYKIDGQLNPDFVRPETIGIMPAYNRAEDDASDLSNAQWCSGGGISGRPDSFFRFDENGYTGTDKQGVKVGDAAFGRNKTNSWKVEGAGEGETATSTWGYSQATYFKNITDTDYVATAKIEYKKAYNGEANPLLGMVVAANHTSVQSFMWSAGKETGSFLTNNINRENDVWTYGKNVSLGSLNLDSDNNTIRMTVVKKGNLLYALVGDKDTEKFGGTAVAVTEVNDMGVTAPGFFAYNCEAVYSDYEVKQGTNAVDAVLSGKTSQLIINHQSGGYVLSDRTHYVRNEEASLSVECSNGYKLTALKVNGTDVKDTAAFENGILNITLDDDTVIVEPTFERISETTYKVSGIVVVDKEVDARDVSILIVGNTDKGFVYRPVLNNRVNYTQEEANGSLKDEAKNCYRYLYSVDLPNGEYTVSIDYLNGIKHSEEQITVADQNVELQKVSIRLVYGAATNGAPTSGTFELTDLGNGANGVKVSENTKVNLNRTYLKEASGTSYVFKATMKIGAAWNGDPGPTAGILFAGLSNNTFSVHVAARENNSNDFHILNISGTGWYWPYESKYTMGDNEREVTFMVIRDGAKFYLFINDDFVTVFTTRAITDTTETCVGFSSVASLSEWTEWEFNNEKAFVDAELAKYRNKVTVEVSGNGSYEIENDYVIVGSDVAIKLIPNAEHYISAITVDGEDAFSMYDPETELLMIKDVREDVIVNVTFAPLGELITISGSYGFGDLDEDSSVKIYVNRFKADVDTANKTFTVKVPEGKHIVTMSCDKYVTVMKEITVEANDTVTVDNLTFDTVKLATDLVDSSNSGFTFNSQDKSYTATRNTAFSSIVGSEYTDAFALKANIKYNTGLWNAAGFIVYAGGTRYEMGFAVENDRTVKLHILKHSPWTEVTTAVVTTLPTDANSCTDGIDVELLFKDGTYYAVVGGAVYTFNSTTTGLTGDTFADMFDTTVTKQLGIVTRDTANAVFKDISYSIEATKVATMLEEYRHTVTVTVEGGNGTHDFANDRVVYSGENVEIKLIPDNGCVVAAIKVNGNDALSDYDNETGIFTLKNVQQNCTVVVTFIGGQTLNETTIREVEVYGTNNKTVTLSDSIKNAIRGEFVSITANGNTLSGCTYNNGVITLAGLNGLKGETEFVATFEEKHGDTVAFVTTINFKALVITRIISNKATLDEVFHPAGGVTQEVLNGYYVLGDNIEYNATWATIGTWENNTFNPKFAGTLDGRGFRIDGVTIGGDNGGFFAQITETGVFKNVVFTNAVFGGESKVNSYGGFVTLNNYGSISNIYWQGAMKNYGVNWGAGCVASIIASRNCNGGTVSNCFVSVTECTDMVNFCAIVGENQDGGSITDVYAKGVSGIASSAATKDTEYVDAKAFLAANPNFSLDGWNTDMWEMKGQMPLPKNVTVDASVSITNTESSVSQGESLTVTVTNSEYAVLSLKTPIDGVTLDGNTLTVGADVAPGTQITVVAKSVYSDTVVEKTFTVIGGQTLNETTIGEVEVYGTNNKTVTLSDSIKNAIRGEFVSITANGNTLSGCTYNNGVITLAGINGLKDTTEFVARFEEKQGDTVIYVTTINFKALVITRIISNKATLDEVFHPAGGVTQEVLNGYYVLGGNIEYNATWATIGTWENNTFNLKFAGTFDGRGFRIDGVTIGGDNGGFFAQITETGVFKNVVFTNAVFGGESKVNSYGGFVTLNNYGSISNIYWQGAMKNYGVNWGSTCVAAIIASNNYEKGTISKCFVSVTECTDMVNFCAGVGKNSGAADSVTNVYAIGVSGMAGTAATKDTEYANAEAFLAANQNFSLDGWDNDFWMLKDGVPYPQSLSDTTPEA